MCDYGECDNCGEQMEERRVKQDLWIKGKLLVIEDVPAGVCPRCGAKEVSAEVGRKILEIIARHKEGQKVRTFAVPVYRFGKTSASWPNTRPMRQPSCLSLSHKSNG